MKLDTRKAKFVYEGARLHAMQLECPVIPAPWEDREVEFKIQFIKLIRDLHEGKREFGDFEAAHDSWMKKYFEMGWEYGAKYEPLEKKHPDLVAYDKLDLKEKVKDEVFLQFVDLAKKYIW